MGSCPDTDVDHISEIARMPGVVWSKIHSKANGRKGILK